eukprot:603528_1
MQTSVHCTTKPIIPFHCKRNQALQMNPRSNISMIYSDTGKMFRNFQQPESAIQQTIDIYNRIEDDKNGHTLNLLMRIFLHLNQTEQVYRFWNDIMDTPHVSYALLLKCCVHMNPNDFDVHKCIETLSKMKAIDYRLNHKHQITDHSKTISKLIGKCTDYNQLKLIQNSIDKCHDIHNKTALIAAFGKTKHHNSVASAIDILNSIDQTELSAMAINTMMTVLMDHNHFERVLSMYDEYDWLIDDISHSLAIKACAKSGNKQRGYDIADTVHINDDNIKCKQFKTSLIDFYGHFGDMDRALSVFNRIRENGDSNVFYIGALMNAYNKNNAFQQALDLYDDTQDAHHNDVTHLLAIKACRNLNNYNKG